MSPIPGSNTPHDYTSMVNRVCENRIKEMDRDFRRSTWQALGWGILAICTICAVAFILIGNV